MAITQSDVEKIAHLARLELSASETEAVASSVSDILELVDKMQAINTDGITPLSHPFEAVQKLREDEVNETNHRDELQTLAPSSQDGLYLVPKVID